MSKKTIQLIVNIIVIINIIIIVIFGYHIMINNKYSRKKVNELLEKNIKNINYIMEIEDSFIREGRVEKEKIVQKENTRKEENMTNGYVRWYTNDFTFVKSADRKVYYKAKEEIMDLKGNVTYRDITTKDVVNEATFRNDFRCFMYIDSNADYKYLRKETYNNVDCIVIEFIGVSADPINNTSTDVKVWIDLDTGFEIKEEHYCDGVLEREINYRVEINIVTDKEIDSPDIEEYTFIEKEE